MVKNKANYMQQQRYIDKSNLARHVSGNNSAHLQELCNTAYGMLYPVRCWSVIW
jgi:hypothetical protein